MGIAYSHFNTSNFDRSVHKYVLSDSSVPYNYFSHPKYIPPSVDKHTFTLVFDLDDTLMYTCILGGNYCSVMRDFALPLLSAPYHNTEIIVWTASLINHAKYMLNLIDPLNKHIKFVIYNGNDGSRFNYYSHKDTSLIQRQNVMLIDDSIYAFKKPIYGLCIPKGVFGRIGNTFFNTNENFISQSNRDYTLCNLGILLYWISIFYPFFSYNYQEILQNVYALLGVKYSMTCVSTCHPYCKIVHYYSFPDSLFFPNLFSRNSKFVTINSKKRVDILVISVRYSKSFLLFLLRFIKFINIYGFCYCIHKTNKIFDVFCFVNKMFVIRFSTQHILNVPTCYLL